MARWRILEPDSEAVSSLREAMPGADPLCARVLANRGISPEAAPGFMSPSLSDISPPEGEVWEAAADRLARAIEGGERIAVFGDYDTDGITSAALLYTAISGYTENVVYKLPTRQVGYSLLEPYVRDLFSAGIDLLVTADCGISNRAEVELAASLGMDVIVTDHHLPPEDPPESKLWDLEDPLAGVGVAWKLAWALARRLGDEEGRRKIGRLLDLVSIGTIVDIAPLIGDNRALASAGLKYLNGGLSNGGARPGIAALVKAAKVRGGVDEQDLGWRLGPRINSIGRIKNPGPALELLLTDDRREAARIADELNYLNGERQKRTRRAVEAAMGEVEPEQDFKVVVSEEVGGLAGLVAGRVAGATGRPAAVLGRRVDGGYGGSARAGETEVDLHGAIHSVRHLLGHWGGHRKAAGLSIEPGNFDAFVEGVNRAVREQHAADPDIFEPPIQIDAEVTLAEVSNGLLDWHERLAPFGSGNHRPVFASKGLRVKGSRQLWEGMNLVKLRQEGPGGGVTVSARLACEPEAIPDSGFDAVYTVGRSRYSGEAELEILDWKR
jgi:single-stranded-DNA-specific exonuclease